MKRVRNQKRRRLLLQPLESRRVLTASFGWDGPEKGSAELTYYVANHPASLTQAETEAAIETALNAWSSVVDITFAQTDRPGLRDSIDISFTSIDGTAGAIAQAYFPDDVNPARIAGDIQFDLAEAWEVGNSLGSRAFDLVWVAVHEIGHALGLDHSNAAGSILAPFVSPFQYFTGLTTADISAIQQLYAADATSAVDDDATDRVDGSATPAEETTDPTSSDPTSSGNVDNGTPGHGDGQPFPFWRWRRGGGWTRFGGRLSADEAETNYILPSDPDGSADLEDSGGTEDEDSAMEPEVDDEDSTEEKPCHNEGERLRFLRPLLTTNAADLLERFDANVDGSLTDEEVPARLWTKLLDVGLDADGDGAATEAELDAALIAIRQESFDGKDLDGDGLLIEDEIGTRLWTKVVAADSDGNSAITFEEWSQYLESATTEVPSHHPLREHHHHRRGSDAVFAAIGRFGRRR